MFAPPENRGPSSLATMVGGLELLENFLSNAPCFLQGQRIVVQSVKPNRDQGIAFGDVEHERVSRQVAVRAVRIFGAITETGKRLRCAGDRAEYAHGAD